MSCVMQCNAVQRPVQGKEGITDVHAQDYVIVTPAKLQPHSAHSGIHLRQVFQSSISKYSVSSILRNVYDAEIKGEGGGVTYILHTTH